jgi:hypothetical protein
MNIIDLPVIARIRRNHGLEHASLTLLTSQDPTLSLAGFSYPGGFFVLGEVGTDELSSAVYQALTRLQNGERKLAVHPNCGTNFVTTGIVAGLLAWMGMGGARTRRERFERLPLVISLVTLATIYTRPLGPFLQEHITTSGDPAGLRILDVFPIRIGNFCFHRVATLA